MRIRHFVKWLRKLIGLADILIEEAPPHTTIEYPSCIIPTSGHVIKLDIKNICDTQERSAIVRRSTFPTESQTFNEFGVATEDAIIDSFKRLTNMSCNMLGGEFTCDHIRWRQTGIAKDRWDGVTRNVQDFDPNDLHNLGDSVGILIPLKELYQIKYPFKKRTKNKDQKNALASKQPVDTQKEILDENGKKIEQTTFSFEPGVIVEHSPSNSNYWHVELSLTQNVNCDPVKMKDFKKYDENTLNVEDQHHTTIAAMEFMQRLTFITKKESDYTCEAIPREIYVV